MKKIFQILLFAAFLSNAAQAQTCSCNPAGWQPSTALINKVVKEIKCGYQFSLKCNDVITIRSQYKCLGKCTAKYSAVLKNSLGVVVITYPTFTFPWTYHFTTAGNYSLEIIPVCGDAKCTPCRYFFTVTCNPACDCSETGWQKFIASNGSQPPLSVNCGYQFGVKKGSPFKLNGKYICKGKCTTKYIAVLKNNVTGAIIQNYNPFTFPWAFTFNTSGNFKLEIVAICGDKKCQPCVFYFTVD